MGANGDAAHVIPLQPRPKGLLVNRTANEAGTVTGLTYIWHDDDGERCRRCPPGECGLTAFGVCNVQVPDDIPDESCPTFSLVHWRAGRGLDVGGLADKASG